MAVRDVYLKIETILGYSPVEPDDHVSPPIVYRRDCMRNMGHEDGTIPLDEVNARRLTALIYREYLDPQYLVPKPDKLVAADINEPAFTRRVPGAVIYARPGDDLRIHVKNADVVPHSFHLHGVHYGIDSDGSWPFGTQSDDGRRSDEICPGQTWTYRFHVTEESVGAWPFHDHCRNIGTYIDRGLFGGLVVLPEKEHEHLPKFPIPNGFYERLQKVLAELSAGDRGRHHARSSRAERRIGARHPLSMPTHGGAGGSSAARGRVLVPIPGAPRQVAMTTMGPPPVPMPEPEPMGPMHGMDLSDIPPVLVPYLTSLDELAHAPHPLPERHHVLHVPLFYHVMSGMRGTPVFQSAPLNPGSTFVSPAFSVAASYDYICEIHGPSMSGSITVQPGGPSSVNVSIGDFLFSPANVTVGIGGKVTWTNNGPSQHSVVERGGANLPSYCFKAARSSATPLRSSRILVSGSAGTSSISTSA